MTVLASQKSSLAPLEWLALKIVGKSADQFRDACPVARKQNVDFLLRVQGTVDVSPDRTTTKRITEGPSVETVLAHVLKRLPPETAQLVRESINAAYMVDPLLPIEDTHLNAALAFVKSMQQTSTTTGTAKGSTRGVFQVGRVSLEQIAPAVSESIKSATRLIDFGDESEQPQS